MKMLLPSIAGLMVPLLLGVNIAHADSFSLNINNGGTALGINVGNPPPPVIFEPEVIRGRDEDRDHFEERHRAWEHRHAEELHRDHDRRRADEHRNAHQDEHRDDHHQDRHADARRDDRGDGDHRDDRR